jgi:hypothetical protein
MGIGKQPQKTPVYVKILAAIFAGFCVYVAIMVSPMGPWLDVRILKHEVEQNIGPDELQQWATNLLAHHRNGYHDYSGTNLPAGLKRISGRRHELEIFQNNGYRRVAVFCGGKGESWLVVGPPSMPTPTNSYIIPWKPGIYFMGY